MRRVVLSLFGGVLVPVSLFGMGVLIMDILGLRKLEPIARVLIVAAAWPLKIFGYIFPNDELALGPTNEALLATVILDILIYSTLVYLILSLRAERKILP